MFCKNCGKETGDTAKFCENCGVSAGGIASQANQSQTPTKTTSRPLGIVLIVAYTAISALMIIVMALGTTFAGAIFSPAVALMGLFLMGLGVAGVAEVYGLWKFERWGHTLALVTYVLSIPLGVLAMFDGGIANMLMQVAGIVIAALVLWYIHQPHIRVLYGK